MQVFLTSTLLERRVLYWLCIYSINKADRKEITNDSLGEKTKFSSAATSVSDEGFNSVLFPCRSPLGGVL